MGKTDEHPVRNRKTLHSLDLDLKRVRAAKVRAQRERLESAYVCRIIAKKFQAELVERFKIEFSDGLSSIADRFKELDPAQSAGILYDVETTIRDRLCDCILSYKKRYGTIT